MKSKKKVLVIGDVIIDRYAYVATERISAEAPIPVWDELRSEERLGGAANVAMNLLNMSDNVDVYIAGTACSHVISKMVSKGFNTSLMTDGSFFSDSPHSSIIKKRFVREDTLEYIARFDNSRKFGEHATKHFVDNFKKKFRDMFFDAIIISDYNAGTINAELAYLLCKEQRYSPVFVDSKRDDLSIFDGAFFLKVNEQEHAKQVSSKLYPFFQTFFTYVAITLGARGCDLTVSEKLEDGAVRTDSIRYQTEKVQSVDVTGCGDTFVAAVVFYITNVKANIHEAIKFANRAAAIVVQRFGTSSVSKEEIDVLLHNQLL